MFELSDKDVADYARIIFEDYGVLLSPEQARIQAQSVLNFAALILRPPKQQAQPRGRGPPLSG
jgi:hypothetical protein